MAFPVGSLSAADNAWLASAHDLFMCGDGGRQDEIVQQVVEYLARLPVSFLLLSCAVIKLLTAARISSRLVSLIVVVCRPKAFAMTGLV